MTSLLLILAATSARANVGRPVSITRTRLHVEMADPMLGGGDQILLETKRYRDTVVHVLSRAKAPRSNVQRVIAASTAKTVEKEMSSWIKKVGAAKGGLDDLGCTRPLGTERARRRGTMCLSALGESDRRAFYEWFKRTADLAR